MTNQIREDQFQVVNNLLSRQDEALEKLDELCERVEQAIDQTIASRELLSEDSNQETTDVAANAAA